MRQWLFLAGGVLAVACNNLEDAPDSGRSTFVRFYGSELNYEGRVALADDDGYIVAGNARHDNSSRQDMVLIKTDLQGNRVWEQRVENARVNDLLPVADGYILTGESIQLNPTETEVVEQINTNLLLVKISRSGTEAGRYTAPTAGFIRNPGQINADTLTIDTRAFASTLSAGNIVAVGSYTIPNGLERSVKISFSNTLVPNEAPVFYDLQAFSFQNSRSVFAIGSNFIWASTAVPQSANELAFATVTNVPGNSGAPAAFNKFGENETDRQHLTGDMQQIAVGFGLVGTYSERGTTEDPVGANANIFVARLNAAGAPAGLPIYLDGDELFNGTGAVSNPRISSSQDTGDAICATSDGGFVVAGTYLTTPTRGNGQKDVLMAKLDAFGNVKWARLFGGAGTELVGSVRETPDRHLLLCGTSVSPTGDVTTLYMARFDANGELKN